MIAALFEALAVTCLSGHTAAADPCDVAWTLSDLSRGEQEIVHDVCTSEDLAGLAQAGAHGQTILHTLVSAHGLTAAASLDALFGFLAERDGAALIPAADDEPPAVAAERKLRALVTRQPAAFKTCRPLRDGVAGWLKGPSSLSVLDGDILRQAAAKCPGLDLPDATDVFFWTIDMNAVDALFVAWSLPRHTRLRWIRADYPRIPGTNAIVLPVPRHAPVVVRATLKNVEVPHVHLRTATADAALFGDELPVGCLNISAELPAGASVWVDGRSVHASTANGSLARRIVNVAGPTHEVQVLQCGGRTCEVTYSETVGAQSPRQTPATGRCTPINLSLSSTRRIGLLPARVSASCHDTASLSAQQIHRDIVANVRQNVLYADRYRVEELWSQLQILHELDPFIKSAMLYRPAEDDGPRADSPRLADTMAALRRQGIDDLVQLELDCLVHPKRAKTRIFQVQGTRIKVKEMFQRQSWDSAAHTERLRAAHTEDVTDAALVPIAVATTFDTLFEQPHARFMLSEANVRVTPEIEDGIRVTGGFGVTVSRRYLGGLRRNSDPYCHPKERFPAKLTSLAPRADWLGIDRNDDEGDIHLRTSANARISPSLERPGNYRLTVSAYGGPAQGPVLLDSICLEHRMPQFYGWLGVGFGMALSGHFGANLPVEGALLWRPLRVTRIGLGIRSFYSFHRTSEVETPAHSFIPAPWAPDIGNLEADTYSVPSHIVGASLLFRLFYQASQSHRDGFWLASTLGGGPLLRVLDLRDIPRAAVFLRNGEVGDFPVQGGGEVFVTLLSAGVHLPRRMTFEMAWFTLGYRWYRDAFDLRSTAFDRGGFHFDIGSIRIGFQR